MFSFTCFLLLLNKLSHLSCSFTLYRRLMVYPNSSSSLYFLQSDGLQVKSESGFPALYESIFCVVFHSHLRWCDICFFLPFANVWQLLMWLTSISLSEVCKIETCYYHLGLFVRRSTSLFLLLATWWYCLYQWKELVWVCDLEVEHLLSTTDGEELEYSTLSSLVKLCYNHAIEFNAMIWSHVLECPQTWGIVNVLIFQSNV